ncbi:MAG TPA: hypothetical protein VID70_04425 [Solirubrobacteraceae bacterium]|jgi:hypothetical protein
MANIGPREPGVWEIRESTENSGKAHAETTWIGATPQERGEALRDLLLLTDRLPVGPRRAAESSFPRLRPRAT